MVKERLRGCKTIEEAKELLPQMEVVLTVLAAAVATTAADSVEHSAAAVVAVAVVTQALEERMDALDVPLAFASKGALQAKFLAAADYSDEWSCVRDPAGNIISAMRVFYLCTAGGAYTYNP